MSPFLTLYTPTYRRPYGLARCLESVRTQTIVADLEQIVIPDHVGVGIDGMYRQVPNYAAAVHGRYVAFLCDDDVLHGPQVAEAVRDFARAEGYPPLILVGTEKNGQMLPVGEPWPPQCGSIDLNCAIVRSDVWRRYAAAYGHVYEGDYVFMKTLYDAGVPAKWCPILFSVGGVSRGAAEAA